MIKDESLIFDRVLSSWMVEVQNVPGGVVVRTDSLVTADINRSDESRSHFLHCILRALGFLRTNKRVRARVVIDNYYRYK